jgi:hypothetical protein
MDKFEVKQKIGKLMDGEELPEDWEDMTPEELVDHLWPEEE